MWEIEVICERCDENHLVHSPSAGKPRAFSFACPTSGDTVAIKYRDPSVIARPWKEVAAPSDGSIAVGYADGSGALDV